MKQNSERCIWRKILFSKSEVSLWSVEGGKHWQYYLPSRDFLILTSFFSYHFSSSPKTLVEWHRFLAYRRIQITRLMNNIIFSLI